MHACVVYHHYLNARHIRELKRIWIFWGKIEESEKAKESNPGHLAWAASALPLSYDNWTTTSHHNPLLCSDHFVQHLSCQRSSSQNFVAAYFVWPSTIQINLAPLIGLHMPLMKFHILLRKLQYLAKLLASDEDTQCRIWCRIWDLALNKGQSGTTLAQCLF